jgi:hypothetical protein
MLVPAVMEKAIGEAEVAAATALLGIDVAEADPNEFDAVTVTESVARASAEASIA